jgi:hypothetical protein
VPPAAASLLDRPPARAPSLILPSPSPAAQVERVGPHIPLGPAQIEVQAARVIAKAGQQKYALVVQGEGDG